MIFRTVGRHGLDRDHRECNNILREKNIPFTLQNRSFR